jgi:hypothetical protein
MKKHHIPNHKNLLAMLPNQIHTQKTAVLVFFLLFFFAGFVGKGQDNNKTVDLSEFKEKGEALIKKLSNGNDQSKNTIEEVTKILAFCKNEVSEEHIKSVTEICKTVLKNEGGKFRDGKETKNFFNSILKKITPPKDDNNNNQSNTQQGQTQKKDTQTGTAQVIPENSQTNTTPNIGNTSKKNEQEIETFTQAKKIIELENSLKVANNSLKSKENQIENLQKVENPDFDWQNLAMGLVVGLFLGLLFGFLIFRNPKSKPDVAVTPKPLTDFEIQQEMKKRNLKTEEIFIQELSQSLARSIPAFNTVKTKQEFLDLAKKLFQKTQETAKETEIDTTKTVEKQPITNNNIEASSFVPVSSVRYAKQVSNVETDAFKTEPMAQTIYKVELTGENEAQFSIEPIAQTYAIANFSTLNSACSYNIAPDNNTKSIQTTQKGKLVNQGGVWIVKEKAVIVFK